MKRAFLTLATLTLAGSCQIAPAADVAGKVTPANFMVEVPPPAP